MYRYVSCPRPCPCPGGARRRRSNQRIEISCSRPGPCGLEVTIAIYRVPAFVQVEYRYLSCSRPCPCGARCRRSYQSIDIYHVPTLEPGGARRLQSSQSIAIYYAPASVQVVLGAFVGLVVVILCNYGQDVVVLVG